MSISRLITAKQGTRLGVGIAVAATAVALAAPAFGYANPHFLGKLAASAPSPSYPGAGGTVDASQSSVAITTPVTNLTANPVTVNLCISSNQILTLIPKGGGAPVDISSGNPTVTFYNGWFPNSTQGPTMSGPCATFTVPASAQNYDITMTLPLNHKCGYYQYDIRNNNPSKPTLLSAGIIRVLGCGGNGVRLTPGYWKNHQAATTALLPVNLGNYTVSTFAQAKAVFVAMKCSNAADCLAGHLLAAELDVANGASNCISAVIDTANKLLASFGYSGPGSVSNSKLTSAQIAQAKSLASQLDSYTNDSTSSTC
jgi:hypothetical protein